MLVQRVRSRGGGRVAQMKASALDPETLRRTLRAEQVRRHEISLAAAPLGTGAIAAGLALLLWPLPSPALLLSWLTLVAATLGARFLVGWQMRRSTQPDPGEPRWLAWHRVAIACQGLAWAALAFVMQGLPPGATHEAILFALVVLLAGAVLFNAYDTLGTLLFVAPASLPALVHVIEHQRGRGTLGLGLLLTVALVLAAVAVQGQRSFRNQVRRREQWQAATLAASRDAQRLERVGALARIGAWEFDLRHQVLQLSAQVQTELGMDTAGPHGIDAVLDRIDPTSREPLRQAFEQSIESRQPFSLEAGLDQPRGSGRRLLVVGRPVVEGGRVVRVEGAVQDITELHRAQQQLRLAKDEAERASAAKSQFLSQMSHELRTPLNAILGFGQVLGRDGRDPLSAAQQAQLDEMMRGARHLLDLISGLLDLGRIEAGRLEISLRPLHLQAVVDEALALMQALADRQQVRLPVAWQVPPGLAVQADATRLLQVLLNLLGNAIKYNRPGGEVDVLWQREGAVLRLGVRDQGAGLRPEEQALLFQPFERLGAEGSGIEGTGIGLALSRRLMQAMGGDIEVDSRAGQGSTFWLRLGCTDVATDTRQGPEAACASPGRATPSPVLPATRPASADAPLPPTRPARTVLCIEDNPVNLLVIEAMVTQLPGLALRTAANGADGLRSALDEPPALVLTDIQMPGMDGFALLERLRAEPATRDVPVVAISADALPASVERGRAAGFTDYLTKPVEMAALHALLERLVTRHEPR